jgi:ATP-binding cassette, subfamily C, bacterial CydCD
MRLPWSRLVHVLRPHRGLLSMGAVAGALAALAGAGLLATSTWLIQRAAEQPPVLALLVAIVAVRALALVRAVARWGERTATHAVGLAVVRDLRARTVRDLVPRVPEGLPGHPAQVLERVVGDLAVVEQALVAGIVPLLAAAVTGITAVAVTAVLDPAASALLAVGLLLAGVAVPAAARRSGGGPRQALAAARDDLVATVADLVAEAPELDVAGIRDDADDRAVGRAECRLAHRHAAIAPTMMTVVGATVAAVAAAAVGAVGRGDLAGVALGAVILLALGAFEPLFDAPLAVERLDEARRAWGRLDAITSAPPPVRDAVTGLSVVPVVPVVADHVAVRRPGAPSDVLADVDLRLARGARIALTGPSGAGKSTLAATLVRFLAPRHGRVTYAGRDGDDLGGDAVRGAVGLAAQDAHVFPTTVAANLRLAAPNASAADLMRALDVVGLGEWVADLPQGLDTRLGADASHLSGGQRRRLAVAQLLLAERDVWLLDEPTAELDPATGRTLVSSLLAVAGERPVLLVTHARHGVGACDGVVTLVAGRVSHRTDRPAPPPTVVGGASGGLR